MKPQSSVIITEDHYWMSEVRDCLHGTVRTIFYLFISNVSRPTCEDQKTLVSFHHVGPENQTQVVRLGSKRLHLLSQLAGPRPRFSHEY